MNLEDIRDAISNELESRKRAEALILMLFTLFQSQKPGSYDYIPPESEVVNSQEVPATDRNYTIKLRVTKAELDEFCRLGLNLVTAAEEAL